MPRLLIGCLAASAMSLGCAGDDAMETTPGTEPPVDPPAICAPGTRDLGDRCQPAGLPDDLPCPPGELALDDGACLAAGIVPGACGDGFVHDGGQGCEPVLPAAPCMPAEIAVPGDTSCRPLADCGSGTWGLIATDGTTQHVDASYTNGDGDGSALKPWPTVQAGVDAAIPGAIVAIAAGSYVEDVVVDKPLQLWGRCPALVEIAGAPNGEAAVSVESGADGSIVRGVAVTGPARGVRAVDVDDALIEDVWSHDTGYFGGSFAWVQGAAGLVVRNSRFERNATVALRVEGSTSVIEGVVVRDSQADANGELGLGIRILSDRNDVLPSAATVRGSLVDSARTVGLRLFYTEATVDSVLIRNTRAVAGFAAGMQLVRGRSQVSGVVISGSELVGIELDEGDATIETTVVRSTTDANGTGGRGINVQPYSGDPNAAPGRPAATFRSVLVDDMVGIGVGMHGADVTLEAAIVRGSRVATNTMFGWGVGVFGSTVTGEGSSAVLRGSRIEQHGDLGVMVGGSDLTVESSIISDTSFKAFGGTGRGINIQYDDATGLRSSVSLYGSSLERNHQGSVVIFGGSLDIEASEIRDTGQDATLRHGVGVVSFLHTERPQVTLQSLLIEGSHRAGMLLADSDVDIRDSVIRNTVSVDALFGDGIFLWSQDDVARASVQHTLIENSERAAFATLGGELSIERNHMVCQALDMVGDDQGSFAYSLADDGDNSCGCPSPDASCRALSQAVQAPEPLTPIGQ